MTEDLTANDAKEMRAAITKDANLGELARAYPDIAQFLQEEYGLHCVGCAINAFDTLETGLQVHGYTDEDIEQILQEVNSFLGNNS